jgi:diacylglycerol kinase (ATP)
VIFNPTARGDKARTFRACLDKISGQASLKPTTAGGEARRLAAAAVGEGFEVVVAAGGDGTVNEVLNGLADASGFASTQLAVLPLGTVNVFAKDLGIPADFEGAWRVIQAGRVTVIDLPSARFHRDGEEVHRHFAQLAGTGLDARAIELTSWPLKRKFGPLAYIVAGFQAFCGPQRKITATSPERSATGELILIGNGRFYGGRFRFFPKAQFHDGLLDVCVFPRVGWLGVAHCGWGMLTDRMLDQAGAVHWQSAEISLQGDPDTLLELDGENVGGLPATLSVRARALSVITP